MPVAMVPPPRGGLAFEMVFEFGVENTLGKRLLQLVEKPVLVENLFRVTAVQKLVQGVFLDRHKRLRRRHYGPAHKIPDSPPPRAVRPGFAGSRSRARPPSARASARPNSRPPSPRLRARAARPTSSVAARPTPQA